MKHLLLFAALLAAMPHVAGAETMRTRQVEAGVPDGPLRGTLAMPRGEARAAAVVIPGSGPTDRDGNSPLGVSSSYLRKLAGALAEKGVASVRVDKRGLFASTGSFGDPNAVTFDDYAADARAWAEVASREAGTDCAWLVGHSEGGLVALVAAQQAGAHVCGLVLVAAPGRPLGEILREQFRANPANAPLLDDALAAIDSLERREKPDISGYHPAVQAMFPPALQDFLIDAFSRDPAVLIAGIDLPVLIVQGDEDIQVRPLDAQLLGQAQPSAETVVLPGMNHVLATVPHGDMAANLAAYGDPDMVLADGLADAIADFVTRGR